MKQTVFISRNPSDCLAIEELLKQHTIEVIAQSLIETIGIPFDKNLPLTDWIFFSSSNAARFFFEKNPTIQDQKIGAIGDATADAIRPFHSVDFVGDSSDITDSAYRFADTIGSCSVLFPGAANSLRHIQSALPAEQVIDFPVYKTVEHSEPIALCDAYVFSSPSNVRAFFKGNPNANPAHMICIAFGEATREELKRHDVLHIHIPQSLEAQSIADTIIHVLRG
jgi:uroporphyrinogen-III synthase